MAFGLAVTKAITTAFGNGVCEIFAGERRLLRPNEPFEQNHPTTPYFVDDGDRFDSTPTLILSRNSFSRDNCRVSTSGRNVPIPKRRVQTSFVRTEV